MTVTNPEMKNYVSEILSLIKSNESPMALAYKLSDYHENDLAEAFELMSQTERQRLCRVISMDQLADIFEHLDEDSAAEFLTHIDLKQAATIMSNMEADDASTVLHLLPKERRSLILQVMDEDARSAISLLSTYDEDEIGSRMTMNYVVIQSDLTIKQAMKELVRQASDNDNIQSIFVTNQDKTFYGEIDLPDLIRARETDVLEDLIITSYPYVYGHELIDDCVERLKDYSESSIPVLDEQNRLLGAITSVSLMELIHESLGDDYAKLGGLTEQEDLEEPPTASVKKRLPWLLVLLVLGMLVSTVVSSFEGIVSQVPIIIAFQSLILDMSGNVGTQSLAVTIRVLSNENLTTSEKLKLVWKEVRVGGLNGIILGILAFIVLGLYLIVIKQRTVMFAFLVSGCIGISLLIAMIVSSLVGTVVPIFFKKIHIDPAAASGPLITTVTDLVAVVCYYGLSWLLLIEVFALAG